MKILVVGAHWDDIELGCALTLQRLAAKSHDIFTVVVCGARYGLDALGLHPDHEMRVREQPAPR
jgi:LmbE family N-acetylglucosaminyl deacetylase